MFTFTSVQVLSVVKIAPVSGGAARSALGARNNPAITAINVNMCEVVLILLLFRFLWCWGYDCWRAAVYGPHEKSCLTL